MKKMFLIVFIINSVTSLHAMDDAEELIPVLTDQERHSHAISESISGMLPTFLMTLPLAAVTQYIITLPTSTATSAALVAALNGLRVYYETKHPTPIIVKWKQLIALRPRVVNTIEDIQRELKLRSPLEPSTICERLGLVQYKKFMGRNLNETLSNFIALSLPHIEHKIPASVLALHFAKRKYTLEKYREMMIHLAPYALPASGPLLDGPIPKVSIKDYLLCMMDPEGPEQKIATQATMRSCNKMIGILETHIFNLRQVMGE